MRFYTLALERALCCRCEEREESTAPNNGQNAAAHYARLALRDMPPLLQERTRRRASPSSPQRSCTPQNAAMGQPCSLIAYAVTLVAWSGVAAEADCQIPLLDVLADAGADLAGAPENATGERSLRGRAPSR